MQQVKWNNEKWLSTGYTDQFFTIAIKCVVFKQLSYFKIVSVMVDRIQREETNIEAIDCKIKILLSFYICKFTMKIQIYGNISSLLVV